MTSDHRSASFYTAALPDDKLLISELHGFEGLSRLSEIHLTLNLHEDTPFDIDKVKEILKLPAAVCLTDSEAQPLYWFGILRRLDLMHAHQNHETVYRAVLVPSVWYLTQTVRSRVFFNKTVIEVIDEVLESSGFINGQHYHKRLEKEKAYPVRETIVQYQESDFDFLSRLLEHEGIFYYFKQSVSGEEMIIGDYEGAFEMPPVFDKIYYRPGANPRGATSGIHAFTRTYRVLPEQMVVREYSYSTPNVGIHGGAQVDDSGYGMRVLYGEHFSDESDGTRYAKIRAQELVTTQHIHQGRSSVSGLHAGDCFKLVDHSFSEFTDKEYVVVGMHHSAEIATTATSSWTYSSQIEVLPKNVPFRPPRLTRKPRISGLMHGKIDGEVPGTPAPIDDHGRYRVLLPYDLEGEAGKQSSRWIRLAQTFSGPSYGMHFPLHIGTEVVVAHLDGDPNRPVIIGAVPNPSTASPVTSENATQSLIRTMGNIVLEFEDDANEVGS